MMLLDDVIFAFMFPFSRNRYLSSFGFITRIRHDLIYQDQGVIVILEPPDEVSSLG